MTRACARRIKYDFPTGPLSERALFYYAQCNLRVQRKVVFIGRQSANVGARQNKFRFVFFFYLFSRRECVLRNKLFHRINTSTSDNVACTSLDKFRSRTFFFIYDFARVRYTTTFSRVDDSK